MSAPPCSEPAPPPDPRVQAAVEHVFRRDVARIVATLTRYFGPSHLELVEDVVQEALLSATRVWTRAEIPANPAGWIWQVARARATDELRRRSTLEQRVLPRLEPPPEAEEEPLPQKFEGAFLQDDVLRLIFLCCHPLLDRPDQLALTLKTACSFGVGEIARALLLGEAAVAKRLVRARAALRERGAHFDLPQGEELAERLPVALEVLYLLFNEGHSATRGDSPLRADLCDEAIRLGELLLTYPPADSGPARGLLALMLFHRARAAARFGPGGEVVLLADQDRSRWDRALLQRAAHHMGVARGRGVVDVYLLQAAIAGCHCLTPRYEDTDWGVIVGLYDLLRALDPSPVVALNRAVAVAHARGPGAGLEELEKLGSHKELLGYHLFHASRAELLSQIGRGEEARAAWERALSLAQQPAERQFIEGKLSGHGRP